MKKIFSLIFAIVFVSSTVFSSIVSAQISDPFEGKENVTIMYLGGSITQGAGASSTSKCWVSLLSEYFVNKYQTPTRTVTNYNRGIGGTGSNLGLLRLKRDIMSYKPDMVFIEFAVNDRWGTENDVTRQMESIVLTLQQLENAPYITFVYTTTSGLNVDSKYHQNVADYYGIPSIDLQSIIKADTSVNITDLLNADGVHPNDTGYEYYYTKIRDCIETGNYYAKPAINGSKLNSASKVVEGAFYNAGYYKYTGNWSAKGTNDVRNLISTGSQTGTVTFDFTGSVFATTHNVRNDGGKYSVTIDGQLMKTMDTYSTANQLATGYTNFDLPSGKHTVVIAKLLESNVSSSGSTVEIVNFITAESDTETALDNYFVFDDGKNTIDGANNFSKHGFFLLETDKGTGEHFVLSQRSYELSPIDNSNTSSTIGTVYSLNPNSSTNLAYKMNTGTLLTNNVKRVYDSSWSTKLKTPSYSNFPKAVFDPFVNVHSWTTEASGKVISPYTISSKYSILSRTEYEQQILAGDTDPAKTLTRVTDYMKYNELEETTSSQRGHVLLRTASAQDLYMYGILMNSGSTTTYAHEWACSFLYNREQQVKPIFYAKKDFFKSVKLEVATMGKNIKNMLFTKYTRKELTAIGYTDSELTALGFVPEVAADYYFVYDDGKNIINGTDNFSKHGFFLLDTNSTTGEHFVLSQRSYELAPLDDANLTDDGTIYKLDPNSSTNLAYKMNSGTLLTGNKRKVNDVSWGITLKTPTYSNFPKAVFDPLVNEHTWSTEKSGKVTEAYTFSARYSILSKTEYETHILAGETDATKKLTRVTNYLKHNELSLPAPPSSSGQKGQLLLRTASPNKAYMYGIIMNIGNTNTIAHDWACLFRYNTEQQIKPVFYAQPDFFKSVKLEVSTMGKNIKSIITKYTKEELASIGYTESELITLGYEPAVAADNYFQYDDKGANNSQHGFYLLDTTSDNQSKFFVISERTYANAPLDSAAASLRFDPTVESNVAYKMNSGNLLTSGAYVDAYYATPLIHANFPAAVSDYADANHVWTTEKSEINQDVAYADKYISEQYQITAKFALLSKTEFNRYYRDGTGFNIKFNVSGTDIGNGKGEVMFRSSYGAYYGAYMYGFRTKTNVLHNNACVTSNKSSEHQIKPVFYLGRNFFPNVKLDVATMGKTVKRTLLNTYTKTEMLSAGYTESEIKEIGFKELEVVVNKGAVTAGATEISSTVEIQNYTLSDLTNPIIIAVLSDENNKMIGLKSLTLNTTIASGSTSGERTVTISNLSGVTEKCLLKIFIWSDFDNIKPLVNAE